MKKSEDKNSRPFTKLEWKYSKQLAAKFSPDITKKNHHKTTHISIKLFLAKFMIQTIKTLQPQWLIVPGTNDHCGPWLAW